VYASSDLPLLSPIGFGTNVTNEETIELFQGLLCSVCLGLFACDLPFAHNERVAFESLEMWTPRQMDAEWCGVAAWNISFCCLRRSEEEVIPMRLKTACCSAACL